MATTPRHASLAPATFPAPGMVAGVQRAIAIASETSDRPVNRARVDALLGNHARHASRMALGIARDPGRAKPARRAAFLRLLDGPRRPTVEEAFTRRRANTQAAPRVVARACGPVVPA